MLLLEHDQYGATLHLDRRELFMVMVLIQEGRISLECDSPTGQALDEFFRNAAGHIDACKAQAANPTRKH